jgi:ribose/xylose/arabinose/galactoside ABC-type transport system permease subunit
VKYLVKRREMVVFFAVLIISAIIYLNNHSFLRIENIIDMLKANTVLGIMSMGMLLVIIMGGIDVSIGAMLAAIAVVIGNFMVGWSDNIILVFLVGCLCGVMLGMINGILIAGLKIPPIVLTLGTMSIINGCTLYFSRGVWMDNLPHSFTEFGRVTLFRIPVGAGATVGFPVQIVFFITAAVLTWIILKFTLIGRGIYAMGGNPDSAVRIGYNPDKINFFLYSYMGFMVGLAAVVHTSIIGLVGVNPFSGVMLQVIAVVVLGGTNILGGAGTVFGTVMGVFLMAIINNGLVLMHIPVYWQKIVAGMVIIIVASIDVIQRRHSERELNKVDL